MPLQVAEFFGHTPLDPAAAGHAKNRRCPFVDAGCIKPKHGACSLRPSPRSAPVICCPNRMYGEGFKILHEIAVEAFGAGVELIQPKDVATRVKARSMTGNEVAVFGRYWGKELSLPGPYSGTSRISVDWTLAKLDRNGDLTELTAVEVQTIDTTGSYREQSEALFRGEEYPGDPDQPPGFSKAGLNWANVYKRILLQITYKGRLLEWEAKCAKGLYFVCPEQVYDRIIDWLGRDLPSCPPGPGTITFRGYKLGKSVPLGRRRSLVFAKQFTITVNQVALTLISSENQPGSNAYEAAIEKALGR